MSYIGRLLLEGNRNCILKRFRPLYNLLQKQTFYYTLFLDDSFLRLRL